MAQEYNPYEMKAKAETMKEQSTTLKTSISKMASVVSEMSSVWESPAANRFIAKFEEIRPELERFCKNIDDFADRATAQAVAVINSETVVV